MNSKLYTVILVALVSITSSYAQRYESLKNEVIELGPRKIDDNSRNYVEVSLPKNTEGYMFRVSLFRKDKGVKMKDTLSFRLRDVAPEDIVLNDTLGEYTQRQLNTESIDFYIVPTLEDAKAFKERKMFNSCLRMPDMVNFTYSTDTCVSGSDKAYICLRNKNVKKDLMVALEVIAIVKEAEPRWSAERKKSMFELFSNKVVDICTQLTEEEKDAFAKAVHKKFTTRYSNTQVLAFSPKEMDDATEEIFYECQKTMNLKCLSKKKTTETDTKEKKKKKKKKKSIFG
jgi:hypothetical protein